MCIFIKCPPNGLYKYIGGDYNGKPKVDVALNSSNKQHMKTP